MSLEENKAIVRKFIEAYNKQNFELLDDYVAPNYFDHTNQIRGRKNLEKLMIQAFKAFPDWHETIEEIIAEGDKVWVLLTYTATHTGEWMGIEPTGNKITTKAVDIYRIENGQVREYWNVTDNTGIFKPVGVIEFTEKGKQLFQADIK